MNYAVADDGNSRVLIYNIPFSTDESASVVLGQPNFTSNTYPTSPSASSIEPQAIAVDTYSNLYVADYSTCRVLQFKPPFTNNMNASVVFGEPDFVTSGCGSTTTSEFENVHSIAIDGDGDLWVADSSSRIMEFVPPFSNGMSATLVIGQPNLTSEGCNQGGSPTASTICVSRGINFDASGDLWVSDTDNNRVLEFKPPFSTGMAASLELGQPSGATAFTSNASDNGGISASTLAHPLQPAFDGDGNLWVPDAYNSRVLEYVPPFSNGMAASLELGQPSATAFTSSTSTVTQSGLNYPHGISFDSSGNIYVVDERYNRVMIFDPPFSNGMNATAVFGQANFTTDTANQGGIGANTLDYPYGGVTF
jgi:sugar lactone lactonase YvrE